MTTSREDLTSCTQLVGRALSTRSAMPSLGGILMTASGGQLTLQATDMELSLTATIPAAVDREGAVLLPGRLLADVVRSLADGEVTLEQRAEQRDVEISAGGSTFHLRTLPADEFPQVPSFDEPTLAIPGAPLSDTVERVAKAASRDEVRPILTGILVMTEEKTLTMVATDSYRLSVKHTELEAPPGGALEANVPARAMRELSRLVSQDAVDEVGIALTRNQIVFRAGTTVLSSRLIEGQFPSYRQLLPDSFEHEIALPRDDLLAASRRISQLAQRNAPLRYAFSEGELTISAETPDVGDAREAMPAPFSGEPLEIAFNPQFVIEGIESIDASEVAFQLTSSLRPGLLRPVGRDDYCYLVMPIRLNA